MNKFSKPAVLFTVLYLLIGFFIYSDIYTLEFRNRWLYGFRLAPIGAVYLIASVVFGVLSIMKSYKTEEKGKWFIILLTLFNIAWVIWLTIAVVQRLF